MLAQKKKEQIDRHVSVRLFGSMYKVNIIKKLKTHEYLFVCMRKIIKIITLCSLRSLCAYIRGYKLLCHVYIYQ